MNDIQKKFALANELVNDTSIFNIGELIYIEKIKDVNAFIRSINYVMNKSNDFKRIYDPYNGRFKYILNREVVVEVNELDTDNILKIANLESKNKINIPLNIKQGEVIKHSIYCNSTGECVWVIIAHHIAVDYNGLNNLITDVLSYDQTKDELNIDSPEGEKKRLTTTLFINKENKAIAYWNDYFNKINNEVYFMLKLPKKALKISRSVKLKKKPFELEDKMYFIMAFAILEFLEMYHFIDDPVINIPFSNRLVGNFHKYEATINIFPLIVKLNSHAKIENLLKLIIDDLHKHSRYSSVDITKLTEQTQLKIRKLSTVPYINIVHEVNKIYPKMGLIKQLCISSGAINNYGITVRINDSHNIVTIEIDYAEEVFVKRRAITLLDRFVDIYLWLLDNKTCNLQDLFEDMDYFK